MKAKKETVTDVRIREGLFWAAGGYVFATLFMADPNPYANLWNASISAVVTGALGYCLLPFGCDDILEQLIEEDAKAEESENSNRAARPLLMNFRYSTRVASAESNHTKNSKNTKSRRNSKRD